MGIGSPVAKKAIMTNLNGLSNVTYPNSLHPSVKFLTFNTIGKCNVIREDNILTTNIDVKDFVMINLNYTIGHDTLIGSYTTISQYASVQEMSYLKSSLISEQTQQ